MACGDGCGCVNSGGGVADEIPMSGSVGGRERRAGPEAHGRLCDQPKGCRPQVKRIVVGCKKATYMFARELNGEERNNAGGQALLTRGT